MSFIKSAIHSFTSVSHKRALYFTLLFIAVVGALLSFQGFDVCDEGLALTVYQQVFNCPSCIEFNFYRWFSAVVGGLWYLLFPNGGIWSFRILTVLTFLMVSYVVFKIFKGYLKPYQIALGTILSAFISDFGFLVFYHNHLTILLYVLIVFLMHRGILNKNFYKIILAGFLTVFCVLSRLPNLTLLALSLAFFYPFFSKDFYLERKKLTIKYLISYLLGLCIGVIVFVVLAILLNHEESLINSFYSLVGHGTDTDSNHNVLTILKTYVSSYINLFIDGSKYIIIGIAFLVCTSLTKHKILETIITVVFIALFLRFFRGQDIFEIYFFIILANIVFLRRTDISLPTKLLSAMALIVALVLPLGSDGALLNMGYASIWLAFPFVTGILFKTNLEGFKIIYFRIINYKLEIRKQHILVLLVITITTYSVNKIYKITNEAYFDTGSRFLKTHSINSPLAKHIYTKERRADIINDLLDNLTVYVKPNDYLLAYDKIPMLHFLTETRPYIHTPWVWVYSEKMFKTKLLRAEQEIDGLPIVVAQKFETIGAFSEPIAYLDETLNVKNRISPARTKALNQFLKRNNYKIVWSNSYFNIYSSNEIKK